MVRSTLHGIFPPARFKFVSFPRMNFSLFETILNSQRYVDRIWPSFDGNLSVLGRPWQKMRNSSTKGHTFVVFDCPHTLGLSRRPPFHHSFQCLALEALLTIVRRWGCEALSNLWGLGATQSERASENNSETAIEGASMMM